jgi:hypothetical protein
LTLKQPSRIISNAMRSSSSSIHWPARSEVVVSLPVVVLRISGLGGAMK